MFHQHGVKSILIGTHHSQHLLHRAILHQSGLARVVCTQVSHESKAVSNWEGSALPVSAKAKTFVGSSIAPCKAIFFTASSVVTSVFAAERALPAVRGFAAKSPDNPSKLPPRLSKKGSIFHCPWRNSFPYVDHHEYRGLASHCTSH